MLRFPAVRFCADTWQAWQKCPNHPAMARKGKPRHHTSEPFRDTFLVSGAACDWLPSSTPPTDKALVCGTDSDHAHYQQRRVRALSVTPARVPHATCNAPPSQLLQPVSTFRPTLPSAFVPLFAHYLRSQRARFWARNRSFLAEYVVRRSTMPCTFAQDVIQATRTLRPRRNSTDR